RRTRTRIRSSGEFFGRSPARRQGCRRYVFEDEGVGGSAALERNRPHLRHRRIAGRDLHVPGLPLVTLRSHQAGIPRPPPRRGPRGGTALDATALPRALEERRRQVDHLQPADLALLGRVDPGGDTDLEAGLIDGEAAAVAGGDLRGGLEAVDRPVAVLVVE